MHAQHFTAISCVTAPWLSILLKAKIWACSKLLVSNGLEKMDFSGSLQKNKITSKRITVTLIEMKMWF